MTIKIRNIAIILLGIFYIILPDYFAFEISSKLPSFTASRIIIVISVFTILTAERFFKLPKIKIIYIFAFFIILIDILHIRDSSTYAIHDALSILLDNLCIILLIYNFVKSKSDIELFIKLIVITSAILGILAIIEFFTGFNVFEIFDITTRDVTKVSYYRLGMRRASSSFGHPVYYGVYCTGLIPFGLYLFDNYNKKLYLWCVILNIIGVFVSGARGQMITCITVLLIFYFGRKRIDKLKYFKYILILVLLFCVIIIVIPNLGNYIIENVKSIMLSMGFETFISEKFGRNADGLSSRIIQLSGIEWLIMNGKFILGFGPAAAYRGLVSYYWISSGWLTSQTIDIGYVGWLLYYGIIGAIVEMLMFISFLYGSFKKINLRSNNIYNAFFLFLMSYMINLLTSTGLSKLLWVILGLYIASEHEIIDIGRR